MSVLHNAIYTEVEPATPDHGTQVVARMGHLVVAANYPEGVTDWADVHAVAVQALITKHGSPVASKWTPALFGAGVIWVCCDAEKPRSFKP